MKRLSLFLTIAVAFCAISVDFVQAQNMALESYARKLAMPGSLGGSVHISMDKSSAQALSSLRITSQRIQGMRVCIYFDNSQNARSGARAALGRLNSMYPNLRGDVVYQNPFFKVMVGDCIDKIEAARLLGVLKGSFPEAIIVNDGVSLTTVVIAEQQLDTDPFEVAPAESPSTESGTAFGEVVFNPAIQI